MLACSPPNSSLLTHHLMALDVVLVPPCCELSIFPHLIARIKILTPPRKKIRITVLTSGQHFGEMEMCAPDNAWLSSIRAQDTEPIISSGTRKTRGARVAVTEAPIAKRTSEYRGCGRGSEGRSTLHICQRRVRKLFVLKQLP